MPFYEYQCKNCGHALEAMQKISDSPLKKCPHCGKAQLVRLMSAPVFRLKGGGWYETDFKGDKENQRNLADKPEPAGVEAKAVETKAKDDKGKADASGDTKVSDTSVKESAAKEKPAEKPVEKPASSARKANAASRKPTPKKSLKKSPAKRPSGR